MKNYPRNESTKYIGVEFLSEQISQIKRRNILNKKDIRLAYITWDVSGEREHGMVNMGPKRIWKIYAGSVTVSKSIESENIPQKREKIAEPNLPSSFEISTYGNLNYSWTKMPSFFLSNRRALDLGPNSGLGCPSAA